MLIALRSGRLTGYYDADFTRPVPVSLWDELRDPNDWEFPTGVHFRREDVLAIWPPDPEKLVQ